MEIEAKFKLEDPSALQFWMHCIEHEQNFGGWVRHDRDDGIRRMRSFYFDTAEEDLAKQRAGLRLRQENETWILTLKQTLRQNQAVSERHEWECVWRGELPGQILKYGTSPLAFTEKVLLSLAETGESDEALRQLCEQVEGKRLQIVAAVDFVRRLTLLEKDQAKIEWALDRGAFLNSLGEQRPFAEMEAEIKAGDEADLADLLEIFRHKHPLEAERRSKLERALTFQRESQAR